MDDLLSGVRPTAARFDWLGYSARTMIQSKTLPLLALALLLVPSCAALRPRLVDASVQKPSNVAVYFTVDTREGEPVPGLTVLHRGGEAVNPAA